jgi:hypothetical protein
MIRVRPEFFSWSRQKRGRYSANLPEKRNGGLDEALTKDLLERD